MRTAIYDPFSGFRRLQHEVNRAFGGNALSRDDAQPAGSRSWVPAVDIHEEADRFVIKADVPGIEPKAIEITAENGVLTIQGERRSDHAVDDGASAQRVERSYGSFFRRFTLPDSVDADHIEARGSHGVLEITVPKREQVKPKRIKVSA